ncbi:Hypothetical predicted protein [Olea europaea subsp. europaea]|uniref:Uncharacterized protein n=1 Tax=Olea europaea subsp. europaea TaxID=158383 RepID=A0A8S0UYL9_OLEEU|nr:Hypothetical predicted protein [Olea europaea subsp. europaea]
MSQKTGGRHQRRPSQGAFAFPDNFSDPLTEDIGGGDTKMPPPATAPPPQQRTPGKDGSSLPPPLPPKSMEGMPASDHNGKNKA